MTNDPNSWLVIGVQTNWDTSLTQPIPLWGLKPRYLNAFQVLRPGDFVWIYVTDPVRGVVGVAVVKDKYQDYTNLVWPEEIQTGEVIWPLRFRLHVMKVLPRGIWTQGKISITDLRLNWQIGFHLLNHDDAATIMQRAEEVFGTEFSTGATIIKPAVYESNLPYEDPVSNPETIPEHRDIQELVAEIGKLQFYHTELEYPIELEGQRKSLDVVWKREMRGSPTFAFEVELSSGLEKAVGRLKFAYRRWNSRPRIVVPTEDFKKVENILIAEDRDFSQQLRIYEPEQLAELLRKKKILRSVERELGIY